jgi:hypothetical protein
MCEINLKINPKVVNANRLESVTNLLVTGKDNKEYLYTLFVSPSLKL